MKNIQKTTIKKVIPKKLKIEEVQKNHIPNWLTWEEIEKKYPDKWLFVAYKNKEDAKINTCDVLGVFDTSEELSSFRDEYDNFFLATNHYEIFATKNTLKPTKKKILYVSLLGDLYRKK
ncbi:MAG: hypothetical protein EAZ85_03965 [Bacteroidetes bacterium]|nr:MAG: hypothetical protein EAZ85_03965 [Bacteroidota bacterium]TAG90700.1 MAG: hypothetical protein EAZ20_03700 [Bacteroidota bacterium]